MYLSKLIINPKSRGACHDLANFYELHRTLLRAYPQTEEAKSLVLFTVDIDRRTGIATVVVQSTHKPDWSFLENFDSYLLKSPLSKEVNLRLRKGQALRFRLRANPTKRTAKKSDGSPAGYISRLYKPENQVGWLKRKAESGGFAIHSMVAIPEGDLLGYKDNKTITMYSVIFEGILVVKDVYVFLATLSRGIGRGKRFGFGLLSVAPFSGA